MIRKDFPYLDPSPAAWRNRPVPESVGNFRLAALGRVVTGVSFHDDETGDADTGPVWFARIDFRHGESLAAFMREWAKGEPDETDLRETPLFPVQGPGPYLPGRFAGMIYGRDSSGFEIVGVWTDADGLARAWNRLAGVWAEPDFGFALRMAENDSRYRVRRGNGVRIEPAKGLPFSVAFRIVSDSGADHLVQGESGRVGIASDFGYRLRGPFGCKCSEHTDGSEDCPECGKAAADFAGEASDYLRALCGTGIRAEDAGYFESEPNPDGGRMPGCTLPDEPRAEND